MLCCLFPSKPDTMWILRQRLFRGGSSHYYYYFILFLNQAGLLNGTCFFLLLLFWFSFRFSSPSLWVFFCRIFGEKGRNSARDRRRERLVPDVQQRFIPTVYRSPMLLNFFLGFFCYFNKNVALEPGPPRSWEPLLAHGEGLGFGIWDFSPKIPPALGSWWG